MEKENTSMRIEGRNKNFLKQGEFRSTFSIDLRKSKRASEINRLRFGNALKNSIGNYSKLQLTDLISALNTSASFKSLDLSLKQLIESAEKDLNLIFEAFEEESFLKSFFDLLSSDYNQTFQLEISYLLTLVCEKCEKTLLQSLKTRGIIPYISRMLNTINTSILSNYLRSFGILSSHSTEAAQEILSNNFLSKLDQIYLIIKEDSETLCTFFWLLANLTRKEVILTLEQSSEITKYLSKFCFSSDPSALFEILRGLCGISYRNVEHIQVLFEKNIHNFCFALLGSTWEHVQLSAIRILSNMTCESNTHIQILLNLDMLGFFLNLVGGSSLIKAEIYKALANVAHGSPAQIIMIVEHKVFKFVVQGIFDRDSLVRLEASAVIRNAAIRGCNATLSVLVHSGILEILANGFEDCERQVAYNCALSAIALIDYSKNYCIRFINDSGIIDALGDLLMKKNIQDDFMLLESLKSIGC